MENRVPQPKLSSYTPAYRNSSLPQHSSESNRSQLITLVRGPRKRQCEPDSNRTFSIAWETQPPLSSTNRNTVLRDARAITGAFLQDKFKNELGDEAPNVTEIVQSTSTHDDLDAAHKIAALLREVAADIEEKAEFQKSVKEVEGLPPKETFFSVAQSVFSDGIISCGRIAVLLQFGFTIAHRMYSAIKDILQICRDVLSWIVIFMKNYLLDWIVSCGGWLNLVENPNLKKSEDATEEEDLWWRYIRYGAIILISELSIGWMLKE